MKQHQYRVTVEYLADSEGREVDAEALCFDAPNHDDVFQLVGLVREKHGLSDEAAARFVVGLKLMTEVMLEERRHPLFAELKPAVADLMKTLKNAGKPE